MFKTLFTWVIPTLVLIPTLSLFAVLFDPTELALGAKFIELPEFLLSIAENLGNALWLFGIFYAFIAITALVLLFNKEIRETALNKVIAKNNFKGFEKKWHEVSGFVLYIILATLFIGSGFWFTGFTLLSATLVGSSLSLALRDAAKNKI